MPKSYELISHHFQPTVTTMLPGQYSDPSREVKRNFFCELCQKGYARMNELEAHEGSYDHQHRKRMKEMKALMRDSAAPAKREAERRAEEKATGIRLNITSSGNSALRKVPVVKKIEVVQASSRVGSKSGGGNESNDDGHGDAMQVDSGDVRSTRTLSGSDDPTQAKTNGWYEERYQPEVVTASEQCGSGCSVCQGRDMMLGAANDVQFGVLGSGPDCAVAWKQWWQD